MSTHITPDRLAALALEVWRASGPRTEGRRYELLVTYAETYFGPSSTWSEETRDFVGLASLKCRQRTLIYELEYAS